MRKLKVTTYRGGVVTFRIPATWREEHEPKGGGTFFEKGSNSTLRLNVMTMTSKNDLSPDAATAAVQRQIDGIQIRDLTNGNAVAKYVRAEVEQGHALQIHYWELASPLPPRQMRLAVFSYTTLASESNDALITADLELLDESISRAEFAGAISITAKQTKKPWWKVW